MKICSYHLVRPGRLETFRALYANREWRRIEGLYHSERMAAMTLGARILSPERLQLRRLAVFAVWENEAALDTFLNESRLGRLLATGWHVRLRFFRRWGHFSGLEGLIEEPDQRGLEAPVVALTLARLKLPEVFRFVHWGRPVEEQVRDHPATTLALATFRPFRTFSTFSVWRSQKEMVEMVHGHTAANEKDRHASAMKERERRDFHHEFTTLRFRALSEYGDWEGRTGIVPGLGASNLD